ncbi:MAG TPA: DUF3105 domain-containing protein [Kofleriaceae bacterium]|nr:DUF3105 domain-containing protein [Kofleriaceae bacterium]
MFALAGCGDNDPAPGGPLGRCGQVTRVAEEPALHVTPGQAIGWSSNPPATGRHYPAWAGWNRSYSLLARGYWLHNAEHGGVVLLHNCPDGCAADVEALLALVREQPRDGQCSGSVRNRILVVADPDLPPQTRFAAVAWGAYYAATCLDPEALGSFIASHYARGPEDLCGDGLALGGAPI